VKTKISVSALPRRIKSIEFVNKLVEKEGAGKTKPCAKVLTLLEVTMSHELTDLLTAAKKAELTSEEKEAQRRSFAYGNTKIENDRITRELVDQEADRLSQSSPDHC
jgi:hypothetical protein